MRKWLIVVSLLSVASVHAAPAWKWVDKDGQVHYSDRPVNGAQEIDLPGAQGFSAPPPAPASRATTPAEQPQANYRTFDIVSPIQEQTLWNIGGNLAVQVAIAPPLEAGHRIDLVLDGQRLRLNTRSMDYTVPNVFRGVHVLNAIVIGTNGAELLRSAPVTISVQQASIQNPNSPQAGRATRSGN